MSLANPGMLTEYEGPSRSSSRRSRGTVRVRDPAHGFFVAGSSLPALNGIYGRVRNEHVQFLSGVGSHRPVRLAYRHDKTGWLMVLVDISPEERPDSDEEDADVRYGFKEPCDMQWRFIDDKGLHRLRHKGDTIIPGAGVRWKHLPLPKPPKVGGGVSSDGMAKSDDYVSSDSDSDSNGDAYYDADAGDDNDDQKNINDCGDEKSNGLKDVPLGGGSDTVDNREKGAIVAVDDDDEAEEYDEDELPWQVIALLDRSVLQDLRFSSACRDEKVDRALMGLDVQQPCQSTTVEGFLEAERRMLRSIESGVGSFGSGSDDDDRGGVEGGVGPKGWLYRVTAKHGVQLFTAPPDGIYVNESDDEEEGVVADVDMDSSDDEDNIDDGGPRAVGMRSKDDYVRIIEQKGDWLCLARHELPLRDVPLQVGDKVKVISGHYKGETGEITEEASKDTKEFGVHLAGYTGTGKLHAACMLRTGPHPLSRAAVLANRKKKAVDAIIRQEKRRRKRESREREREMMQAYYGDAYADYLPQYYNNDEEEMSSEESDGDDDQTDDSIPDYRDCYKGKLWVQISAECGNDADGENNEPSLVRIPEHAIASLRIGSESCHAELYDKPFEPRLEGGSTHSASSSIDGDADDEDIVDDKEDETKAPSLPVLLSNGSIVENADISSQCTDGSSLTVGLPVSLCGLKSHARYNGRTGAIITRANADGRIGVRLDPSLSNAIEECDKKLLLLPNNIVPISKESSALDLSNHLTSEEQDHASRAARVLNVHVDAIGLGNSHVEAGEGKKLLDIFLRTAERNAQSHNRPRVLNVNAQQLQHESLQEARRAHSALSVGIDKVSEARDNNSNAIVVGSSPLAQSPSAIIEAGLLGERAKAALALAAESRSFDNVERCLSTLRGVLKDEQARIVRARAVSGLVSTTIPDWKLEQAEKDAANDVMDSVESNDCLLIRLAIISVLFDATRITEASKAAKETVELYSAAGAAQLWLGRCLISEGMRIEGIEAINKCVTVGPHSGPGGGWAHREGVKRLRSMKRTLKCEIRARDSYERGKFKEGCQYLCEMMTEYEGYARDDKWGQCEALVARAACHRRDRNLKAALTDCDSALQLYPRYPRALFRRALCLLEDQHPTEALAAFEQLLRVDRNWPNLLDWLIRATAQAKRHGSSSGGGGAGVFQEEGDAIAENKDYYAVLGVSTDATEAQLKRAYRLMSLKVHPDKAGGSAAAFHQVAEAFETLSDPEKRQLYDDGVDTTKKRKKKEKGPYDSESSESEDEDGNKKKSLREEVERRYFPDHFQFWPFGDPFVNKRRHQQRKKKQAEQEKARKERMKSRTNHQPPSHPWWQGHSDWDI